MFAKQITRGVYEINAKALAVIKPKKITYQASKVRLFFGAGNGGR